MSGETLVCVLTSLLLFRPHANLYVCTYCGEALKTKTPASPMDTYHVLSSLPCDTCG